MSNITNNYEPGSCVFEAGSSQNGDVHITAPIYQGGTKEGVALGNGASVAAETKIGDGVECQSPVHLSSTRGTKIDFIRVINCLYELGFFTDDKGGRIAKKDVMTALGAAVGIDLTSYDNDLSRSLSDSTKLEKHLAIFERMRVKMEEVFNAYGG